LNKHQSHSDGELSRISHAIDHAAHFLPAQGPITVFIHHNTLHALEHLPFEEAVRQGAVLFGCRAWLSEERYREELANGRIRDSDITSVLLESLGDEADIFVGLLGTRFNLRRAILRHPLHAVLPEQLEWVVSEQKAFDVFSPDAGRENAARMISATRRWLARDGSQAPTTGDSETITSEFSRLQGICEPFLKQFPLDRAEKWSDAKWESFTLKLLWSICLEQVTRFPAKARQQASVRHRDALFARTRLDSDKLVHESLIPFCLGLLDQGLSKWHMPDREKGVLSAFCSLHLGGGRMRPRWLRRLPEELAPLQTGAVSPLQSIAQSLSLLGIGGSETGPFITQTLLALRGFAGMIWQVEKRADRIAHGLPPGSLIEFLAIRLILDRLAISHIAETELGGGHSLSRLRYHELRHARSNPVDANRCEAFAIFLLAQSLGWHPDQLFQLSAVNWKKLLDEIRLFDETERLKVFHLAYEWRYRQQSLDAMHIHHQSRTSKVTEEESAGIGNAMFDVVTCIDEREESFRRHLEEVAPTCRTWGAAGFFNVAMYFRAADSFQFVPLCPIVIEPRHFVEERVSGTRLDEGIRRTAMRRRVGATLHGLHSGSRNMFYGAMTALFGTLAAVPLTARVLFPRFAAVFRSRIDSLYSVPEETSLQLDQESCSSGNGEPAIGFSPQEMADITERLLRDIGMTSHWSRLVILLGHGSTSLNNPHRSAYDCGACGGGCGGPNARAWARMANDVRVRGILATRGLVIPETTVFVGGWHNTCNDRVTFFDQQLVPETHRTDLELASKAIGATCRRNAHERCRRFASADTKMSWTEALRHVEERSEDLSQVRPECGHATNALCIVARRDLTRGLFLDRRAFLHSYDPKQDDEEGRVLARILAAVVPVCAGINLEYFFSYVDPEGYGCGTKLPHNVASLVGVMNGAASDLRTGLPWQMVEIHEPVRLLLVVETTPEILQRVISRNPVIEQLVGGHWLQVATIDPGSGDIHLFRNSRFARFRHETDELKQVPSSLAWYQGWRGHLEFAQISPAPAGLKRNRT
jgi:uncharacterized protein